MSKTALNVTEDRKALLEAAIGRPHKSKLSKELTWMLNTAKTVSDNSERGVGDVLMLQKRVPKQETDQTISLAS